MKITRTFYDVGDALFTKETLKVDSKSYTIMYDCGSADDELIKEAIKDGEDIDVIFLSHYHADHINGLQKIVRKANVRRLILPMISYPDACMVICMNFGKEQDLVWDFFIDPHILLGDEIQVVYVYGENNQQKEKDTKIDLNLSNVPINNQRLDFSQYIIANEEVDWIYLPFNPFTYDKQKEDDFFKKLSNAVDCGKSIDKSNIKEIWKDEDLKIEIKKQSLKILKRFPHVPNINATSMTLYTGHCKTDDENKLPGCLYTGDYDAKTPDSIEKILSIYDNYIDMIDIIQVPHHGSRHSNSNLFYYPFKNKTAILSMKQSTTKISGVNVTIKILKKRKLKMYNTSFTKKEIFEENGIILKEGRGVKIIKPRNHFHNASLKILLALLISILSIHVYAQDLSVRSFNLDLSDQTANVKERLDLNKQPCALIKVSLPLRDVVFEGDIIGDIKYSAGEYWVYVIDETEMLTIKHDDYHALNLTLSEKVKSRRTYRLIINTQSIHFFSETTLDETLKKGNECFQKGDYINALIFFKNLADNENNAVAQKQLGIIFGMGYGVQQNHEEAFKYFVKSAEQGNPDAQCNLGVMYYYGMGIPKDYIEAVKWYRKSAEQGNPDAQCNLGNMYENGDGVSKDYAEAAKWYRKSADQGNAEAQNCLGGMYYYGDGISQDYVEAVKWYQKSAEQENIHAQYNLGIMYERGYGVSQNYVEAVRWYRKSAEQGDAYAQCGLGLMYEHGNGVNKDFIEAAKWYRKSAEQGYARAQCNLGTMYYWGYGVSQDYVEAFKWYKKSAEQEDSGAQNNLGAMYQYGTGVSQNYSEAIKWYRKSAMQGLSDAQCNLASMYYNSQNYVEAVRWCRKSAEQGNARAQYSLGYMYYNGIGVSQNYLEAVKWFQKSAAQGYKQANEILKQLEKSY